MNKYFLICLLLLIPVSSQAIVIASHVQQQPPTLRQDLIFDGVLSCSVGNGTAISYSWSYTDSVIDACSDGLSFFEFFNKYANGAKLISMYYSAYDHAVYFYYTRKIK